MSNTQEPWARALLGSCMRSRRIAREFGVHKDARAGLRLFQSFAFRSGMFGCQVWGTRFAHMSQVCPRLWFCAIFVLCAACLGCPGAATAGLCL